MKFLFVLSTLFLQGMSQNLCGSSQNTPLCANQFNGNYINCYCVFDPISKTMSRQTAISQSSTDLNLCQNSNQNTFCCPYNFLDRSSTFIFNGYVYDKMCNNLGLYTPPPVSTSLLTTNVEAFVTLYVVPDTSTQVVPTSTTVTSIVTQVVPTITTTSIVTQVVPIVTTITQVQVVPTTTTFVSTEFVYPTQTTMAQLAVQTAIPTVTKTIIRTKIVRKTICPNKV